MNEAQAKQLDEEFARITEAINDHNARLSAQQYLLEQLYANIFIKQPDELETMLTGMVVKTLATTSADSSIPPEAAKDMTDRIAHRLELFRDSVLHRIDQRQSL